METNARYGLIGGFTLAVIAAGFLFVFWLHSTGGSGQQTLYRLRFEGSVAGLRPGSSVMFNGIRVGEVKGLRLDRNDPLRVEAVIGVEPSTPVRADTRVVVDTQGLMGAPSVLLAGGTGAQPPGTMGSDLPTLAVAGTGTETLTQSALGVLRRVDKILSDNEQPVTEVVTNVRTFTEALARNSEKIDTITEGLNRMLGGSKDAKPAVVYDLTVPASFGPLTKEPAGRLAVMEPTALVVFDTQKMLTSAKAGERSVMAEGQWSDSLPKLLQAKVVQSFENTAYLGHVSRGDDAGGADMQLLLDIRNFEISTEGSPKAVMSVSAKLQSNDGQIAAAKLLTAEAPMAATDPETAARGFSAAFGKLAAELLAWTDEQAK